MTEPSLDPYYVKLERFDLFSTNQCYYLVACDKHNTFYRVIKMDRTLIERPPERPQPQSIRSPVRMNSTSSLPHAASNQSDSISASQNSNRNNMPITRHHPSTSHTHQHRTTTSTTTNTISETSTAIPPEHAHHTAKPTLRPLTDFVTEDPNVYTQDEIKDMLDMIHDGNRMASQPPQQQQQPPSMDVSTNSSTSTNTPRNVNATTNSSTNVGGGLKPIVNAYGIVGFVRFLDCYYLTLVTKRAKAGSLGGNGIYTIKNTETIALKPAELSLGAGAAGSNSAGYAYAASGGSGSHGLEEAAAAAAAAADPSSVLLSMWNRGKRSVGLGLTNREIAELRYQGLYQVVDLTKHFYFSYTYDLTRSLQENILATSTRPFPPPPAKEMFTWNHFLTQEFEACLNPLTSFYWIMPIIHGAYSQRKVIDYGKSLNLVLIARRSRHFAGTRYLKRGVSEEGKVANDVEHEQIVHDESISCASGVFSSYLQVRGSIPTFWTQESSVTMPKPPIEINRVDPTYTATQSHFEDLMKRYSYPVIVLDLVKQSEKREREVRVGNEFRHAIDYINQSIDDEHMIRYCALDYSHITKHRNLDVTASLNEVSTWAVNQTGFFCSAPKWKILPGGVVQPFTVSDGLGAAQLSEQLGIPMFPMEQSGVLRTNCIDCLDRTNSAQFRAGVNAVGQQLVVMGIRSKGKLDTSSSVFQVLIEMYVDVGDSLALQYGGSEAHKKVTASKTESAINIPGPIGKHKELLTSIRRYYSNAFTDRLKQDAINLFLGYYIPYLHSVPLWEMETDFYLHNFHVKADKGSEYSMNTYRRSFGIDWKPENLLSSDELLVQPLTGNAKGSGAESPRTRMVRSRCQSQNESLSHWWKRALQLHIKERMWLQLGQDHTDEPTLSRFDRLYQPRKLSQFDRFFTRGWATPVRRSHSAQMIDGPEIDDDTSGLIRVLADSTEHAVNTVKSVTKDESVSSFVFKNGFDPPFETLLSSFLPSESLRKSANVNHLSLDTPAPAVRQEYLDYVAKPNPLDVPYSKEKVAEFKSCLQDNTLDSDDVKGIRRLANSAHIGSEIRSGPYSGLTKSMSAIQVATAIHEQFSAFQSLQSGERQLHAGGKSLAEMELERQGLGTEGVLGSIRHGWDDFTKAAMQYTEIVDGQVAFCRRSDLTTGASLRQYVSCVDPSTTLTQAESNFLSGENAKHSHANRSQWIGAVPRTDSLLQKANNLGISMIPRAEFARTEAEPLYRYGRLRNIPSGWEQINEDLFARKDNKFMVFNGAGIDSWSGDHPITKIAKHQGSFIVSATL